MTGNGNPEASGHVLIVEDDRDIQAIYLEMIDRSFDVNITQAMNGREGVEAVRRRTPDLIILDLLMPVMNGEDFLKELRGPLGKKSVPVIICSVNQALARKLLDDGKADAVLPKLFAEKELAATIARLAPLQPKKHVPAEE